MFKAMTAVSIALCIALCAYIAWAWRSDSRQAFLPGETSHGHYQIELACETCHTPFEGVKQEACESCHAEELELADDSHPASKFSDPRNADRVALLDARSCITCHVEHKPALTRAMGVTLPGDYCYRCHQDIAEERPTHEGLAFNSCQSAGCHNFHDNRALHEDYLERHLDEPDHLAQQALSMLVSARPTDGAQPLVAAAQDAPQQHTIETRAVADWALSGHARAGVNCSGCHQPEAAGAPADSPAGSWVAEPGHQTCNACHEEVVSGMLAGKHGMRLAATLDPMRPDLARAQMKDAAHGRQLNCNSCHGAHRYDRQQAAVDACLGCHADSHSSSYGESPHARLWAAELAGTGAEGTGVSCATCHLPRLAQGHSDEHRFVVQHNQNDNLRPNDKMIRDVCAQCHGVGFALDALADAALVQRNFAGRPALHVESMDMVQRKLAAAETSQTP